MAPNLIANATFCNNKTPLYYAVEHNHKEIVEVLLMKGANVNIGILPLLLAASKGYGDIVQMLLKNKARVNIQDSMNTTPLIWLP